MSVVIFIFKIEKFGKNKLNYNYKMNGQDYHNGKGSQIHEWYNKSSLSILISIIITHFIN